MEADCVHEPACSGGRRLFEAHHLASLSARVDGGPWFHRDRVPFENRMCFVACGSSGCQAACAYSLIRLPSPELS